MEAFAASASSSLIQPPINTKRLKPLDFPITKNTSCAVLSPSDILDHSLMTTVHIHSSLPTKLLMGSFLVRAIVWYSQKNWGQESEISTDMQSLL